MLLGFLDAEAFREHEVLTAFGESLGDHLSVERIWEYLGPLLEGTVGRDGGGAAVVIALTDYLEGELGLGRVHGETGEVVDYQQLGVGVLAKHAIDAPVELCTVELVEHLGSRDEDNTPCRGTGLVGERSGQEGLARAWITNEERVEAIC